MTIVGISLGTTNSMITAYKGDRLIKIPNTFGEYLIPSVVSIDDDGTIYVGKTAKERMSTYPKVTFSHFKEFIGSDKCFAANNKCYTAEEMASFIIKALVDDARNYLGEEITGAVIGVPVSFNNFQRQAVKLAGELAGVKVIRLINEPGAAALGYRCQGDEEAIYMIFDMGGGILEVSMVATSEDTIEVLASVCEEHLGGDNFTEAIAEYFCSINSIKRSDLSPEEENMLLRKCEDIKLILTEHTYGELAFTMREKTYILKLNEMQLIKIYAELLARVQKTVIRAVRDAEIPLERLKDIILVGGGSKEPVVKNFLAKLTGVIPASPLKPEEIVAIGAGTIAGIEEGNHNLKNIVIKDICPFSLGVNIYNEGDPDNDMFSPIIERNSTLPCSKVNSYSTIKDNQRTISFKIYQGENIYCKDNVEIGSIQIDLPETPKGTRAADVRFTYDISGILEVEVVNVLTQEVTKEYLVSSANTMTEDEIQKRLEELQKIKVHPRKNVKNKHLIEWAKRLYQENTGEARELISNTLAYFERALNNQEEFAIKSAYDYCYQALSMLDDTRDYFSIGDYLGDNDNQGAVRNGSTGGFLN
ncbi:Hsp70 family protein [Alloiococcus sp. CFN-8]|uniref:Hsp70 family protein n=1 Tax=Alloiococcus sp. CFN-8 TaxID=3416081 RepID=UPI003CEB9E2C